MAGMVAALLLWLPLSLSLQQPSTGPIRAVAVVESAEACQADPDFVRIDLRIRLRLENIGTEPVIVARGWIQDGWREAPTMDELTQANWGSTDWFPAGPLERPHIEENPSSEFRIVNPAETMDAPMKVMFHRRSGTSLRMAAQLLVEGEVVGEWTDDDIRKAEQRWRRYGRLWMKPVYTEPFTVRIDSRAPRKNCS